ncbi:DUF2155 domain-containing protein [Roseobacter denitrificans]|uniref:Cellulase-like protein n=1 Tax=Roseobacter denitrificans (strain ATCC 33942 / OCh 114) TaxID=375451 RepID=Q165G4_ROSDO|nr:DUF2155 domain-containing protein [Roseobacter denitrificans]ABG32379.1 conserved hypothetical protein [Roseobacter denitrificans OCh 114]AVL51851.1 DUF2155 domain-containing protein [Roseobacter denitrificans]SFF81061.1 hypothetical protein SAMN05443635_102347 [Roseobacter denitrificans OCh 114]
MILRCGLALVLMASAAFAQQAATEATGAQLRGVDRINGETFEIIVPKGQTAKLDRISIRLNACRYPVGNPSGDAFASLEVRDIDSGAFIFSGWMIASSPALSAMDHPRYDIWVMRCTTS